MDAKPTYFIEAGPIGAPGGAKYQTRTDRQIPVFVLESME